MARSIYEIWIKWPNGTKSRLPVLPETIQISNGSQNDSVSISGLGEVVIIQDRLAKTLSFSSFFPAQRSSLVEYANPSKPWAFIERFEMFAAVRKPIRLVVTGTSINLAVSIESFNYYESGGAVGDINYDLTLKEYREITPRKIDTSKKTSGGNANRPSDKATPKTHKVKKGDTLWDLARKYYGNSTQWRKLWEANKDELIKRDSRNLKRPGHYIHIGFTIKVPT